MTLVRKLDLNLDLEGKWRWKTVILEPRRASKESKAIDFNSLAVFGNFTCR